MADGKDNEIEVNDLTYQIKGAVFEVNQVLGAGFLERVYENALFHELNTNFTYPKAEIKRFVL